MSCELKNILWSGKKLVGTEEKSKGVKGMRKVTIQRNKNGDSRVADHVPTVAEFDESNRLHAKDVRELMYAFSYDIQTRAIEHDWTKLKEPYRSMFYRDMCNTICGRIDFFNGEWSKLHYDELERHHLNRHHPEDVNLIDVIEMLCDCVAAGMARSGNVYDVTISDTVLQKAVQNTVELLKECVTIEGEEGKTDDYEI